MEALDRLSVDVLIARYKSAASRHGEATLTADASTGKADADTIASVYRELRRRGSESSLLVLLDSPDLGVRAWALAHAMEFTPEEGEPVLTALADSGESGLIGFGARVAGRSREGRSSGLLVCRASSEEVAPFGPLRCP